MKKLILSTFIFSLLFAGLAQAQVAIGIKAGANFSKFDDADAKNLTNFHGGAFALFKFSKIGIQPELLYSIQGTSIDDIDLGEVDLKTSYMTIPVMVKLYLAGGFNLQAGPQFGFLTSAKFDTQDIKNSLKSSDLSANFGLGCDLPFGLTIDARYNLGLSDVSDGLTADELKSRVIQVSLGYKLFKFGGK